jgi:hypothetical protein
MLLTITNHALTRLTGRALTKKDTRLLTTPQPNVILQILLGFTSYQASLTELIDYIQNDPILFQELEIKHSVESCIRYYAKKLEAAKYLQIT